MMFCDKIVEQPVKYRGLILSNDGIHKGDYILGMLAVCGLNPQGECNIKLNKIYQAIKDENDITFREMIMTDEEHTAWLMKEPQIHDIRQKWHIKKFQEYVAYVAICHKCEIRTLRATPKSRAPGYSCEKVKQEWCTHCGDTSHTCKYRHESITFILEEFDEKPISSLASAVQESNKQNSICQENE